MGEYNKEYKIKRIKSIISLLVLSIILIAIPLYIFIFHRDAIDSFSDIKRVESFLMQYKALSMLIYIGSQVVQIIICIIPGQALQFAAGYLYGIIPGLILSLIGACLGSITVYYISRLLGRNAIHVLFGEKKITEALDHLNSKRGLVLTFIVFLVPGIPKDLFTYAAGLSDIKLKPFIILSTIARTPGMIGSLIIGAKIWEGGYTFAAVVAVIAIILFVIGVIFRKKILSFVDRACAKLMNM